MAIDGDGEIVVIELKDTTESPRKVVAQVLDYASWIRTITYEELDSICQEFRHKPLAQVFEDEFQFSIPETAGIRHSLLIVASELDDSSERIVHTFKRNTM